MRLLIKLVGIVNVDKQNEINRTAAFLSAEHGHVETLKSLLDSGANVDFEVHIAVVYSGSSVNIRYIHYFKIRFYI
jgi:ankyrin repeat protein